jgi:hypothetical protein
LFWKQFPIKLDLFKYCKTGKFRKTTETFKPQKAKVYLWICCKHVGISPTKKLYERSTLVS